MLEVLRRDSVKPSVEKRFHVSNLNMNRRQSIRSHLRWNNLPIVKMIFAYTIFASIMMRFYEHLADVYEQEHH